MLSSSTGDAGDTVARSGWGTCFSASNNMRRSWFVVLAVCVYVLFVVRVTRCMMRVQVHGGGVGRTKGRKGEAWKRGVNMVRLWLALMPRKFVALVRAVAVRHNTTDEGACTLLAVSVEAHVRCTHLVLSSCVVRDAGACRIYIYICYTW